MKSVSEKAVGKRLNIRVSEAEHAAISAKAAEAQTTISEYVRKRALRDEQGPRPIEVDVGELQKIYRDLRHAGGNLNQLCRWLNSRRSTAESMENEMKSALEATRCASSQVAEFIAEVRERM